MRYTLIALAALALFSAGCSRETKEHLGVELPAWYADPTLQGQYFAEVGVSRLSMGGFGEQTNKAMADGRTNLARAVQVKVQSMFERYFAEGGEVWADLKTGEAEDYLIASREFSQNVYRQLTNQDLVGAVRKDYWIHPKTKELFVWVVLDVNSEAFLHQFKQAARNEARRAFVGAEIKAKEELERLDRLIDREFDRETLEASKELVETPVANG